MADSRNISDGIEIIISVPSNLAVPSCTLVSDEVRLTFQWIFFSLLSQFITVFGVVANVINIICFIKQGFKDAANISLLGLAVSDLCSLVPLIWGNICYSPSFLDLELPFDPIEVQYLTGGGLHVIFTRITGCITAFISLERCMCVTMPLKVKTIFSSKLVTATNIIIFAFCIVNMVPVFFVTKFAEIFSSHRNRTIIGRVFTEDRVIVESVVLAISSCIVQMGTFIIVIVCTVMLVIKLRRTSKWRQSSTSQGNVENAVIRDRKVTKMVVTISTMFITSFIPICFIMVAMVLEPELSIEGKCENLFTTLVSLCFLLESTNSAVNIFIYYQMSSKFKSTLLKLFRF